MRGSHLTTAQAPTSKQGGYDVGVETFSPPLDLLFAGSHKVSECK